MIIIIITNVVLIIINIFAGRQPFAKQIFFWFPVSKDSKKIKNKDKL